MPPSQPSKHKTSKLVILTLFLVIILVAAITAGGWLGFQQWQLLQNDNAGLRANIQSLQQTLSEEKNTTQQFNQQLATLKENNQQAISNLQTELINTARRMTESQGVTRYEWLLAEAEYLMRLAQQRLKLEQDAAGALSILQSADAVLRDSHDAGLLDVRAALADEMTALAAITPVDTGGIYLKLASLSKQIQQWPIIPEFEPTPVATEQDSSWLDELSQFIRIREHTEDFQPATLGQFELNRTILILKLEQAQAALLKKNQPAYEMALSQASLWLENYFLQRPQARAIDNQLTELSQLQLNTALPEIGQALKLLKGYIAQIYALQREAPAEKTGADQ
ncbi:putative enzyme of heme biosynthesis [Gynuella sunshinyii YC6258]|uniref:Putative enzyme of heme biosynthesis n=1 Tax=Gynuella sunshinyii YC6258 TaxID=1445510 RepID=A0A0C5VG13_9GAMM|nr:putative enzyme of heme biosynthesis [Gynuella sunshinyii YC6258]